MDEDSRYGSPWFPEVGRRASSTGKMPEVFNDMDTGMNAVAPSNRQATGSWPAGASPAVRRRKVLLSLRIDHDVLEWFREQGPGYQTRMNAVLRAYMEHARGAG